MKKIVFVLVCIFILGVIFYIYSQPAKDNISGWKKEEEVAKILGRKPKLDNKAPAADQQYSGKAATFTYPGEAVVYNYKDPGFGSTSGLIESFSYDLKSPKVVFNYSAVKKDSNFQVLDDSSYHLRTLPERGYSREEKLVAHGVTAVIFKRNEDLTSERSIFILNKNILFTFTITSSDSKELDSVMTLVLGSLRFK